MLNKLWIKNIRSYGGREAAVIEFKGRITLVLGSNGAGKTTILECLRWALTGVLPPGSERGRAFVNSVSGTGRSWFGQVNLTLKLTHTKSVGSISRGLRVERRGTKKMKISSEGHYFRVMCPVKGQVVLADTVSDLNRKVPEFLGMNQAVIEKVMFCHQEEATWPFSDNSTLKKVFDDLFGTRQVSRKVEGLDKLSKFFKKKLTEAKYEIKLARQSLEHEKMNGKSLFASVDELRNIQSLLQMLDSKISTLSSQKAGYQDRESTVKLLGELAFRERQFDEKCILLEASLLTLEADIKEHKEAIFEIDAKNHIDTNTSGNFTQFNNSYAKQSDSDVQNQFVGQTNLAKSGDARLRHIRRRARLWILDNQEVFASKKQSVDLFLQIIRGEIDSKVKGTDEQNHIDLDSLSDSQLSDDLRVLEQIKEVSFFLIKDIIQRSSGFDLSAVKREYFKYTKELFYQTTGDEGGLEKGKEVKLYVTNDESNPVLKDYSRDIENLDETIICLGKELSGLDLRSQEIGTDFIRFKTGIQQQIKNIQGNPGLFCESQFKVINISLI